MVPSRLRASCARCRARSAVLRVVGAQTSRFGAASQAPKNTEFAPGPRPARGPDASPEAARASRRATSRRCAAAKTERTIKASERTIVSELPHALSQRHRRVTRCPKHRNYPRRDEEDDDVAQSRSRERVWPGERSVYGGGSMIVLTDTRVMLVDSELNKISRRSYPLRLFPLRGQAGGKNGGIFKETHFNLPLICLQHRKIRESPRFMPRLGEIAGLHASSRCPPLIPQREFKKMDSTTLGRLSTVPHRPMASEITRIV